MRNYNFKTKYFLTALLMGCKLVSASDISDQNDTDRRHIFSQQPYPPYHDTATTLNWGSSYNDGVITVNPNFPIPTQSTNTFLSGKTDTVSITEMEKEKSFSKTTDQDWESSQSPEDDKKITSYRIEIFKCLPINSLLKEIEFYYTPSNNNCFEITCYFNYKFPNAVSNFKKNYRHIESEKNYNILYFRPSNKNFEENLEPFKKLYEDGVLPSSIIDRILEFSNFKVMDFRTDFEYLQAKIEQLSTSSNNQDQKAEQLSQSSVAGEDVLNIITNHISRISKSEQRQRAYWDMIAYLRQNMEGSDEVIFELCQRITDKTLTFNPIEYQKVCWTIIRYLRKNIPGSDEVILELCQQITDKTLLFYKDAVIIAAEIDFGQDNNLINNIKQRYQKPIIGLLEISSADSPVPAFLTTLTQSFYNNGKLGSNLPPVLQDLKVTPENTFELIDFMREQKIMINKQQLEIDTLKAQLAELKAQKTNNISN